MFTGIVEAIGVISALKKEVGNLYITVKAPFAGKLKKGQSIAHNGVCLTVISKTKSSYTVTAVEETLSKTNLGLLKKGDLLNLERAMPAAGRFEGHIVQGHVDCTALCSAIEKLPGSTLFTFDVNDSFAGPLLVEKGSVCVNGVSLTAFDISESNFSVAIIPHTFRNTNFHKLHKGSLVNVEFDVIGKYVVKGMNGE
jgi:riboflavin synthase